MSRDEQIKVMRLEILGDISDNSNDELFKIMLDNAETVALNTLYPYNNEIQNLPQDRRLKNWQTRCAIELYNRLGTTNVQSYTENGLTVSFLSGLISNNLMRELIPKAGVIK